jgi:hypothetical protein
MRFAAIFFTAALAFSQNLQKPAAPMAIDIKIDKSTITIGQNIQLTIRLTNLTDHQIKGESTEMNGVDMTNVLHIRDSSGREVLPPPRTPPAYQGRPRGGGILPWGKREWQTTILLGSFGLDKPGVYTLQVSRPNLDDQNLPQIVSNVVTLEVDAAKQEAEER